jgi:hypothetical protein
VADNNNPRPNFGEMVAMRKLSGKVPEGFKLFSWEVISDDALMYRGSVPVIATRGKYAGKPRYGKATHSAVVTHEEIDRARAAWEAETGKCGKCGGIGQEFAGWSIADGVHYRTCRDCGGSGVPKPRDEAVTGERTM